MPLKQTANYDQAIKLLQSTLLFICSLSLDFLHLNTILLVACLQLLTNAYMGINISGRTTQRTYHCLVSGWELVAPIANLLCPVSAVYGYLYDGT